MTTTNATPVIQHAMTNSGLRSVAPMSLINAHCDYEYHDFGEGLRNDAWVSLTDQPH